jgi:hypothetical protein
MTDLARTILRASIGVVSFAVKGNQDGIVQQQIQIMGLRQWLSLVVAWAFDWVYPAPAKIHECVAIVVPPLQNFQLKPVAAKMAVPTAIYLF